MKTKILACVAVEKKGKFLLLKRARSDTHPLLWEFPSGIVEDGESLEESASRELFEEAGLKPKKLRYMGKSRRPGGEHVTIVHHFWTDDFSGEPRLSGEHEDFMWASMEQILGMERVDRGDTNFDGKIGTDSVHFFTVESSLTQTVLCLPVDFQNKRILLGMKKQGFGEGKWNGFGGKIELGESPEKAAVRELREETGLIARRIRKAAQHIFLFPNVPLEKKWDNLMHVFFVEEWEGKPKESDEMVPEWFGFKQIPFGKMWQDDSHWLPLVLKGKKLKGMFVFGDDSESIKGMEMEEVSGF